MKQIEEKSDSIILKNTSEEDLDFVVNSERKPENAQYVDQWAKERHKDALCNEDILHLTVEDKNNNEPVGYLIMAGLINPNHNIELKRLVISSKGRGFGRETLKLVKKLAFKKLKAHRLWLDLRYKNQRAQRLYKSEGFIEEGTLRECVLYNGNYESLIIMSILESEYDNKLE